MVAKNYKKYMKKQEVKDYNLLKIFIISFFGMLLVFTFIVKSLPTPDTSIGEYKQEEDINNIEEVKKSIDSRLSMIQEEDQGRSFSEIMKQAEDVKKEEIKPLSKTLVVNKNTEIVEEKKPIVDQVYKVYIGSYTSAEQAKIAKDIIVESGSNLSPIVKCIGSNNYTLQVGIFKNKQSADALLYVIQQNHLPGRIIEE